MTTSDKTSLRLFDQKTKIRKLHPPSWRYRRHQYDCSDDNFDTAFWPRLQGLDKKHQGHGE